MSGVVGSIARLAVAGVGFLGQGSKRGQRHIKEAATSARQMTNTREESAFNDTGMHIRPKLKVAALTGVGPLAVFYAGHLQEAGLETIFMSARPKIQNQLSEGVMVKYPDTTNGTSNHYKLKADTISPDDDSKLKGLDDLTVFHTGRLGQVDRLTLSLLQSASGVLAVQNGIFPQDAIRQRIGKFNTSGELRRKNWQIGDITAFVQAREANEAEKKDENLDYVVPLDLRTVVAGSDEFGSQIARLLKPHANNVDYVSDSLGVRGNKNLLNSGNYLPAIVSMLTSKPMPYNMLIESQNQDLLELTKRIAIEKHHALEPQMVHKQLKITPEETLRANHNTPGSIESYVNTTHIPSTSAAVTAKIHGDTPAIEILGTEANVIADKIGVEAPVLSTVNKAFHEFNNKPNEAVKIATECLTKLGITTERIDQLKRNG